MPKAVALLEDLLASKQRLGEPYRFTPGVLEVKPNRHGISGVFTRMPLNTGTEVLSVPITSGSMTPFRAYEEAAPLLATLGPERFNVSQEFAIAAAIYLRSRDPDRAASDVLITEADLAQAYAGSPMTSYDSLARAMLLSSNNREALEYAAQLDHQIDRLGVNAELFRAILGYISSRAWKGVGVIPVMDWFNASYADGANCTFQLKDGRFCYVIIKDVLAGDELVWNYNNANAVTTWLNYGYVDVERPTLAFLEAHVDASQRAALDALAQRELNVTANPAAAAAKIDPSLFQRELLTPGRVDNDAHARKTVIACMKSFASARAWFRMRVLSDDGDAGTAITHAAIHDDALVFGAGIEARVLAMMRTALATGLEAVNARVDAFSRSDVGRSIDMAPYIHMAQHAHGTWDDALAIAETMCRGGHLDDSRSAICAALGMHADPIQPTAALLDTIPSSPPSLIACMVRRYGAALR